MENINDEILARIVLSKFDFQEAESYFSRAKEQKDKFVRDALIKVGIITYAKPFLKSTGIHRTIKKFRFFKEQIVPEKYYWLHQLLMDYRGNFIGHSNFNTLKPEVPIEPERKNGMVGILKCTAINFDHWFTVDPEFEDIPAVIDQVIDLTIMVALKFSNEKFKVSS